MSYKVAYYFIMLFGLKLSYITWECSTLHAAFFRYILLYPPTCTSISM